MFKELGPFKVQVMTLILEKCSINKIAMPVKCCKSCITVQRDIFHTILKTAALRSTLPQSDDPSIHRDLQTKNQENVFFVAPGREMQRSFDDLLVSEKFYVFFTA